MTCVTYGFSINASIAFFIPGLFMSLAYSSERSFMKYLTVINPVHAEKTLRALELFAESILSWINLLCEMSPE